jgi:hypothetical protein
LNWFWLAPAMCLVLVSLVLPRTESAATFAASNASNHLVSLSVPERDGLASCALANKEHAWNVWNIATIDLSKTSRAVSNTGSFPTWKTNMQKL